MTAVAKNGVWEGAGRQQMPPCGSASRPQWARMWPRLWGLRCCGLGRSPAGLSQDLRGISLSPLVGPNWSITTLGSALPPSRPSRAQARRTGCPHHPYPTPPWAASQLSILLSASLTHMWDLPQTHRLTHTRTYKLAHTHLLCPSPPSPAPNTKAEGSRPGLAKLEQPLGSSGVGVC